MRVLILLGPDKIGGAFVVAEKVARVLSQKGNECILIVKDPDAQSYYQRLGYKVRVIETMYRAVRPLNDLLSVYHLFKIYQSEGCDIIFSHTAKGGLYSRILKFFKPSIRVVHTVHGYYFPENRFLSVFFKAIELGLLPLVDALTFVSQEDYEWAKRWKLQHNLVLIPNGVSVLDVQRDFETDIFNVAVNARIVWEKGYHDVIQLIKETANESIHYHIMGDGPQSNDVKLALKGVRFVTFYGHTNNVDSILSQCHLNVLASYREGLSLSILEAMASGIPSIAYNIRGNRELIDDQSGSLLNLRDIESLIYMVKYYAQNRLFAEKQGKIAKERAKEYYELRKTVEAYIELLERVYKGKSV